MMLSITNAIYKVLNDKFESMMVNDGAFPAVKFEKSGAFKSYSMMDYSLAWTTFTKVADKKIKEGNLDNLGVFTRKRSQAFLSQLAGLVNDITEMDVVNSRERFKGFMD